MTRTRTMHDRRAAEDRTLNAVFHEAAHAVIGERLKAGSVRAIVIGAAGERGYVEEGHVETTIEVGTEERAIVALAGVAAERRSNRTGETARRQDFLSGRRMHTRPAAPPVLSETDESEVYAFLRQWTGKANRQRVLGELNEQTARLVRENWRAICDVAEAIADEADRRGVALGAAEIRLSRPAFLQAIGK